MSTMTNGDPRTTTPSLALTAIDDAAVATIVQQIMAALPAIAAPAPAVARPDDASAKATWLDFANALAGMVTASTEFRDHFLRTLGKSPRQVLEENGIAPGATDSVKALADGYLLALKGGTVARAFWWGFHIQVSHEDLQAFVGGAGAVNNIVDMIGGNIPSPAQPWIKLVAVFIAGALAVLKSFDRGRGVYVSMSWFAPGIFVPTSVV